MGNIGFAIKRFLKNKNTVTIIAILLALGVLYYAYYYRIKTQTTPVSVPYAVSTIGPRVQITKDMVSTKKVPGGIVNENVITQTSEVIGKYVSNKAVIPEGSMFYKDMVVEWEQLPKSLYEDIAVGNTVVYLTVNMETTYGNSIFPGNYIDLYYYKPGAGPKGQLMFGKFIESIKVLAVVDSAGNSVFETADTPKKPSYIMFSVPEEMHILLRKATESGGRIIPIPRNAGYAEKGSENGTMQVVSSLIQDEIEKNTMKSAEVYGTDLIGGIN
ncbi:MAG: hypothetical protein IKR57_04540 [Bacilli bacterium]|nr:hypothetical protein [Bacilli bacterium]